MEFALGFRLGPHAAIPRGSSGTWIPGCFSWGGVATEESWRSGLPGRALRTPEAQRE